MIADAWIEKDKVIVRSKKISKPVYVRYLFKKEITKSEEDAELSLINAEGLPASPFITDDFKPPRDHLPTYTDADIEKFKKAEEKKREKKRERRNKSKKK